jgi:hypothetical protein
MEITAFDTDHETNIVTIHMAEMPPQATSRNTKIFIGGRAQAAPLSVDTAGQEIVFDASGCTEDGTISVPITLIGARGSTRAESTEEYHVAARAEPHDDADPEYHVTITALRPRQAKVGDRVTISGTRFEQFEGAGVFLGTTAVRSLLRAGNTATFVVPPLDPQRYPIKFRDGNQAGLMTSNLFLEVTAAQQG